ncbi:MAG: malate synthase A [Armatimonadota bacterium]|nr:malate synthase A [Armatimonadota bacterium]MDR5696146.1 malate synthase A [Armatimonadota bacterium]
MRIVSPSGVEVRGPEVPGAERVLTPEALDFVGALHLEFRARRGALLERRSQRQVEILAGAMPDFLPETAAVRDGAWRVAPAPPDLEDRRVEITGPVERKMMINALNSGARVFMADFEDALSPTWANVVAGQQNLIDAVRRTITYTSPEGKRYRLNETTATLVVRPRGWHLVEKHVWVDGEPISASLFDFGLYFFHNARELLDLGSGPYFYLPKLESHLEAALWNDVFQYAQDAVGIPRGTIRATVLIETILAAFEMDEILYELRDHASGLNAGRWDYIFSVIKKFRHRPDFVLPDRAQVTMVVPFMRAYTELLVKTCHRRGAHAIGGMAAFIPSRKDPAVNEVALAKVREDKERESGDGFDGTWVAHPDLVAVAQDPFDRVLGGRPHQKERLREDVQVTARDLLDIRVPGGSITGDGVRNDVSVALQYLDAWLQGTGAAAIYNLMEDTATAEICRAQLWQWIRHGARLHKDGAVDEALYRSLREAEVERLVREGAAGSKVGEAAEILDALVLSEEFVEFLTVPGYERL